VRTEAGHRGDGMAPEVLPIPKLDGNAEGIANSLPQ